ncbi:hypothetical protein [Bacillus swezeyi]|uniref:Uncharacterized protein n=1 Tax=Bacillus swezeyi TaxID=1925020 RepID=A0A5M8RIP4_9BACI|nr:hypothetical protein [Bacillus swezeyi]KAA6446923.1 hypothetical protein DX927_23000 [Bacillus swezeyi]KAA6471491.1 hypothetical protein DX928_23240 [Bacillus swezeyi]
MKKPIDILQADIIFKALYYTARNEGVEITEELTEIYEVLAEDNPYETHATDIVDVMEDLIEFIKNSYEYCTYFIKEDDCNDLDDEF